MIAIILIMTTLTCMSFNNIKMNVSEIVSPSSAIGKYSDNLLLIAIMLMVTRDCTRTSYRSIHFNNIHVTNRLNRRPAYNSLQGLN